jgi:hypothetical protein
LEENIAGRTRRWTEEKPGIFMTTVTSKLEDQGVKSFSDAFTVLLEAIDQLRQVAIAG